ncbi:type I restriction-modification system endonuclease [Pseudaminobacter soli (ex Li et al. 2025)]|uniref:Type I restriction-modification system endonuclease n=1 Tax=Pseudaminobacter soli (ex Li et al. 2025) TaxID=1295366 RepID=A0A2P7S0H0_9HYPH|nr:type I restriction-modification system endonuclease [Mesorhizobium soli]PSJ55949.1 type I restriction-modification system endonuclease [Mesorhizobium soli]
MSGGASNFHFLEEREPLLFRLGVLCEAYFTEDPNTAQIELRQFSEHLAQLTAAHFGIEVSAQDAQVEVLRRLKLECGIPREVSDLFHTLRLGGNQAVHEIRGDHASALAGLKIARQLSIWFVRTFYEPNLKSAPFSPPQSPDDISRDVLDKLEHRRRQLEVSQTETERLLGAPDQAELARRTAAEITEESKHERAVLEQLAEEANLAPQELQKQLDAAAHFAKSDNAPHTEIVTANALHAAELIDLDEADTRILIDQQLRNAGWEADSGDLRYAKGGRPLKGRNRAIAEWPTKTGPADYALFCGLTLIGTIEAKRRNRNVMAVLRQAERYASDIHMQEAELAEGGPWLEYKAPFAFSTNGRPYLKQVEALSGIWRRDLRDPKNMAEVLTGWPSPQGILQRLAVDKAAAARELATQPFDFGFALRNYQKAAIEAVERGLAENKRAMLVAMATGTGKTKLAIAMLYRLVSAKRFRRVCFVVDRSALGRQTKDEFTTTKVVSGKAFTDIFGLKGLEDVNPDDDTRIHICTIQGLVRRVLYAESAAEEPPIDQYDLMVVDECHRGYLLDRELSESDLSFRDQDDYVSKYRRVLEHFDAMKIGLTATPALHTTEIFGPPIFTYSYREAVVDGFLNDHEPPIRIATKLSQEGIHFGREDSVDFIHPTSGQVETVTLPDEIDFEVEQFNKSVVTVPFNKAVAEELVKYIDPSAPDKTLIFAVSKAHADIFVKELREAFRHTYGPMKDETIQRLTGDVDKIDRLILSFRNDPMPKVAVTVDLLTTGIDVPKITNLVFMRRVNSRILYEQMLGRATRLCPEIGKENFRIFDAVDLYPHLADLTDMRPVVADPKFTLTRLFGELVGPGGADHKNRIREQIVVRLRRRLKKLTIEARANFEKEAGETPESCLERFINGEAIDLASWAAKHPNLGPILDWANDDGTPRYVPISEHADEVVSVTHGYGSAEKPEDFLNAFSRFVRENVNKIAALKLVVQRPQELTRSELRKLRLELDAAGFTDSKIRRAWADAKNEEIAASIIGFIRQAAIGDPLVPYRDRVRHAVQTILHQRDWTEVQHKWINRIGSQLELEIVVDRAAFDAEPFAAQGGWSRIDRAFNGKLEQVVRDINEQIWKEAG